MATNRDAIIYRRVSTEQQGDSQLGLEAQLHACDQLIVERGLKRRAVFTEVQSGADVARPELAKALAFAKRAGCIIVAKDIERVGRNMAHLLQIMDSHQVLIADYPNASPLECRLRALLAQEERDAISKRTRAALAALKARGVKLGSARPGHWDGREKARQRGLTLAQAAAAQRATERRGDCYQCIRSLRDKHPTATLRQLAEMAEKADILTPHGSTKWRPAQIARALEHRDTASA